MALLHLVELNGAMVSFVDAELILSISCYGIHILCLSLYGTSVVSLGGHCVLIILYNFQNLHHEDANFPHIVHIIIPHLLLGRNKEIDFKTDKLVTHMLSVIF